jgi:hypothetical protein
MYDGDWSAEGRWYGPEIYIPIDDEYSASYDVVRRWINASATPLEVEVSRLGAQIEELMALVASIVPNPTRRSRAANSQPHA